MVFSIFLAAESDIFIILFAAIGFGEAGRYGNGLFSPENGGKLECRFAVQLNRKGSAVLY